MHSDVVIIGGGLSGLSAAVRLSLAGLRVTLLEHRRTLGGRAFSFVDAATGDVVDNGQHLMLGCYHATRRYLTTVGSDHLAELQPSLELTFLRPGHAASKLSCPELPAPAHIFGGLMRLRSLSRRDRMGLLRVGSALLGTSPEKERRLEAMTVTEWLSSLGQSLDARKVLWDVLAIGTLNDDPAVVSALLFHRVLRATFLGKREHSSFLIPRAGLSPLFADGARRFIESRNGRVLTGVRAVGIEQDNRAVSAVACLGRAPMKARAVVSALPSHALHRLLGPGTPAKDMGLRLDRFRSSAIVSVNVWLDREVMAEEMVATLDTTIHWVFNRTAMLRTKTKGQHLCAVISGASALAEKRNDELVRMTLGDMARVFPGARQATVRRALVIKEKRATFSPVPGIDSIRPGPVTPLGNFFLAGDWTATGYPATIEGAILSGERAARAVLEESG